MCVATALMATSAAIGAVGAITNSQSEASADKYNARIAEQNAVGAMQQAQSTALLQQEQARRSIGATTAAYGASGVTMSGTPLDVLANSAATAERDRQNIMYKGQLQAAGYLDQASLDRASATNALNQGWMKAAGILTSGGSKVYDRMGTGSSPGSELGND